MKNQKTDKKNQERNHSRASGSTVLGVSMTDDLKARIKAAADADTRTMANFCTHYLLKAVQRIEAEQIAASTNQDDEGKSSSSRVA